MDENQRNKIMVVLIIVLGLGSAALTSALVGLPTLTHQCGTNNAVESAIDTCGVPYNTTSPITECHQYCTTSLLEGTQGYCSCMKGCI